MVNKYKIIKLKLHEGPGICFSSGTTLGWTRTHKNLELKHLNALADITFFGFDDHVKNKDKTCL